MTQCRRVMRPAGAATADPGVRDDAEKTRKDDFGQRKRLG
jgi:hypothetical protein